MVRSFFLFMNGMVAVCDENGKQMPELQALDLRSALHNAMETADHTTEFFISGFGADPLNVNEALILLKALDQIHFGKATQ